MFQNIFFVNRIFTNKVSQSITWGVKGKDRVLVIKSLIINQLKNLEESLERHTIKDLKELV